MPIKGYNFAPSIFVLELSIQCQFAKECNRRLCCAAPAWLTGATNQQVSNQTAPRDIMIDCTGFLSASGVISKIVFPGRRAQKKIVRRCERLRELLNITDSDLPILRNLAVRNAFEHVDERLDKYLQGFQRGGVAPLSVHEASSDAGTIVLKRFNPKTLTISFANADHLPLVDCMSEIVDLESRLNPALKKLAGPRFSLWP